jgi:hypothetical protein
MRLNRISTFTLGVLVTAVSIGAVNYASAAGDAKIKACANKKSGTMRYISKGSCKKTETSLSWNQMGPQGLQGPTGAIGTSGVNGQNFHVLDAAGRDLGRMISLSEVGNTVSIFHDGGIWILRDSSNQVWAGKSISPIYFSDSSCTTGLVELGNLQTSNPQIRVTGWDIEEVNQFFGRLSGQPFLKSSRTIYAKVQTGSEPNFTYPCLSSSDSRFIAMWNEDYGAGGIRYFSEWTPVTPPMYSAPFTIVSR